MQLTHKNLRPQVICGLVNSIISDQETEWICSNARAHAHTHT